MQGTSKDAFGKDPKFYYVDFSRLDTIQKCQQRYVQAEYIEEQVVKWLRRVTAEVVSAETLGAAARLQESETRYQRAYELYLAGQINWETYKLETRKPAVISESLRRNTSC